MRAVLAVTFALFVAAIAAMPHAHAPIHDEHSCIACSTAASEASDAVVTDVAPRLLAAVVVAVAPTSIASSGAPLGAKRGQSPPRA